MAIFSISLRLLIPLKGGTEKSAVPRISLAMLFFYNGLVISVGSVLSVVNFSFCDAIKTGCRC